MATTAVWNTVSTLPRAFVFMDQGSINSESGTIFSLWPVGVPYDCTRFYIWFSSPLCRFDPKSRRRSFFQIIFESHSVEFQYPFRNVGHIYRQFHMTHIVVPYIYCVVRGLKSQVFTIILPEFNCFLPNPRCFTRKPFWLLYCCFILRTFCISYEMTFWNLPLTVMTRSPAYAWVLKQSVSQ